MQVNLMNINDREKAASSKKFMATITTQSVRFPIYKHSRNLFDIKNKKFP